MLHQFARRPGPTKPFSSYDGVSRGELRLFAISRRISCICLQTTVTIDLQFTFGSFLGLYCHQTMVDAAPKHQIVVGSCFRNLPFVQNKNAVRADDTRKTMGEDERRSSFHQTVEGVLDNRLVLRVDSG